MFVLRSSIRLALPVVLVVSVFALAARSAARPFPRGLVGARETPVRSRQPAVTGELWRYHSHELAEDREVRVVPPRAYATGAGRYPVVFVLDGEEQGLLAATAVDLLARHGWLPPLIVVAIHNGDRNRDFTPASGPDWAVPPFMRQHGGADRFLRHLAAELLPLVDREYRTQPYRVLVGHSLGGLLALHALSATPEAFGAWVLLDPSAFWDNAASLERIEERWGSGNPVVRDDGTPAPEPCVFLGRSHLRGPDGQDPPEMPALTRLDLFCTELRDEGVLHYAGEAFEGASHGILPLDGIHRGLRFVFEGYRAPIRPGWTLADVQQHYLGFSERLGYRVDPPEGLVNDLGYRALRTGDVAAAIQAFEANGASYPASPNAFDSLCEAYLAAHRLPDARAAHATAVRLAREQDSPDRAIIESRVLPPEGGSP